MEDKKIRKTSSQVMELQQLIAGPLIATIEADALSAQKYLDYLMRVAFESYNPVTGETGKLRMLTFTYNEQDVNGSSKKNVSIPLLTLVPLPLLHVEEADFDFDIKILDALSENVEEKFSVENGESVKQPQSTGFKMRASLAPQREVKDDLQQSLSANMKVKVRMRQADMPAGLSNLLHLTANNVQVEDAEAEEEINGNTEGGSDGR
ncbi:DUF2589 domain-containing protein [Prevotella sp.]|uniref:DUF2589 domain-containing protein n=2 Tax=Prevotella herbatica TaxID=2801997 RepID=A0ABM7P0M6_9BACT|nr:hypothetical protein prwr041_21650 [Prevotella herbatica]